MRITRRVAYSVRALVAIAVADPVPVKARTLADTQDIPPKYLYDLLGDLRRLELIHALRGSQGGYTLARPPAEITLGTVIRLLEGSQDDPGTEGEARLPVRVREVWDAANHQSLQRLDEV
ncbi:MAG: hypothetical protein QOE61_3233, partial [Micromonosporaceae bacterium]|nr:hypothetical protein [Micromonosporaceae bacterium]